MNKQPRLFFVLYFMFLVAAVFAQPAKRQAKGMTLHKNPFFYYRFAAPRQDTAAAPLQAGDQLRIQYTLSRCNKKGEPTKVLITSYEQVTPVLVQLPVVKEDIFFTAALRLCQVGDSLQVLVPADSVRQHLGDVERFFKRKDNVLFSYKVLEITKLAEVRKAIAVEKQYADSIRSRMRLAIFDDSLALRKINVIQVYTETETGLYYKIIRAGEPKKMAKSAKSVQVHYLCYLPDGTLVDDSYQTAQPILITPAARQNYIKGWVEGIDLLGEGGQAILLIPPDLAYGEKGGGSVIPPNSPLIFWVEILMVE
jgi:FKBP-type peptidyl-prolyl cis-trans isomerase